MSLLDTYPFNTGKSRSHELFFIAGPCVIETEYLCLEIAETLARVASDNNVVIVFKASYDKANRTSGSSFRGPGKKKGLRILAKVKAASSLPILTDIHAACDADEAAAVADVLQIPAFLCRQTDLLVAAAKTGKIVNVKKGQFVSPGEMKYALDKAGTRAWVTERGTFFGYNRLVVDFAGMPVLKSFGCPVVFDATHSVQSPGGGNGKSSGNRDLALPLARAALCMGADGLFFEIHPDPRKALCDGDNTIEVKEFVKNVPRLIELFDVAQHWK
jgi:2-dehydro-3-deoxyphosphooctonate aldolase (KDO 8-P synthase)